MRQSAARRRRQPEPESGSSLSAECSDNSVGSVHDRMVRQSNANRGGQGENSVANVMVVLKEYLNMPFSLWNSDPFEFWRAKKRDGSLLPILDVVRMFACIPATSVPSEQLFSAAGALVNEKRSRLTPEHVDQLLFLNKNA